MSRSFAGGVMTLLVLQAPVFAITESSSTPAAQDGRGSDGQLVISLISPESAQVSVDTHVITIEVAAARVRSISASVLGIPEPVPGYKSRGRRGHEGKGGQRKKRKKGKKSGTSFFIHDVPLLPGPNEIVLSATYQRGREEEQVELPLEITSLSSSNVDFSLSRKTSETLPLITEMTVDLGTIVDPEEVLIDTDGDGRFDRRGPYQHTYTLEYRRAGIYTPRVLVRTSDNLLIPKFSVSPPVIRALPPTVPDPALAVDISGGMPIDLDYDLSTEQTFVLTTNESSVVILDRDRSPVATVPLGSWTRDPRGFAVDAEANLYVADTGNHRVLRLLAANGYTPDPDLGSDGTFGTPGDGDGELQSPHDVSVAGTGEDLKIFVSDTGNDRIQRFDRNGVFEQAFLGEGSGFGALNEPAAIVAVGGARQIVVDRGSSSLRLFDGSGSPIARYFEPDALSEPLRDPAHVSNNFAEPGLVAADTGNGRVILFYVAGIVKRVVSTLPRQPVAALVVPEAASGSTLLVTANAGSNRLDVAVLTDDPPGFGPVDVVREFIDTTRHGRWDDARELVASAGRSAFDDFALEPGIEEQLRATAFEDLEINFQNPGNASVAAYIVDGVLRARVEFQLIREDGRWKVDIF